MFEDSGHRYEQPIPQGGPVVINVPFGRNVLRMNIIIDATVTITNAGAAGTKIGDGICNLIRRILVLANKGAGSRYPNGPLVDCRPQTLLRYAMVQRRGKYVAEQAGSTLGNGAAGVYPVYLSIPIYFADSTRYNDTQTALNMNATDSQGNPTYSAVQVKIDFAAALTEIFSGSAGTMVIQGMVRYEDYRLDLTQGGTYDTLPIKIEDHDLLIAAAQERLVDQAFPTDGAISQLLVLAQQNQPAEALSDAILERVDFAGNQLNWKFDAQSIRQRMVDDEFYDASQTLTGQYFIDFQYGLAENSNNAALLQNRFAVLNPSGAGLDQLRIHTRRVYGLR